jgi:PAS domain S-box-containing protein
MNMNNALGYFKVITDDNNNHVNCLYLDMNEAFENITGFKREKLIGKSILEVFPGTRILFENFLEELKKVSFVGASFKHEGVYIPNLDKWLSIYAYSPESGYFAVILIDIT